MNKVQTDFEKRWPGVRTIAFTPAAARKFTAKTTKAVARGEWFLIRKSLIPPFDSENSEARF